ncbi:MAG: hypothetical protein EBT71_02740 [Alphaproteobacteria bacterium]|nr:hypothetical protein [Alphaproteobacteria bacterium]
MIEIFALGDSLTAGYGLPPGDGFTPQLQAALRARGHNVRVVNGGVSGDTVLLAGMLAPPNLGRRYGDAFNIIYPTLAKRFDMLHYPFFLDGVAGQKALNLADGIHPNKQGIEVIVTRILPYVETLIDQTRGNAVANRQSRPQ